jgi:hypothetical protein
VDELQDATQALLALKVAEHDAAMKLDSELVKMKLLLQHEEKMEEKVPQGIAPVAIPSIIDLDRYSSRFAFPRHGSPR